ncbi:hypothetical protein [Virgibacillus kimchii]
MKLNLFIVFILTLIFFVSCTSTSTETDIENVISNPENKKSEPELIEEESEDEEPEEFIEFFLDDEQVTINLKGTPILNNYLEGASSRQQSIEGMELIKVFSNEENIYLLEFSCNESRCSYIILNQNRENPSFLIADLAKLLETKLSPDESKLLFLFERDSGASQALKDIVVIDIGTWEKLQLLNETTEDTVTGYTWPLNDVEWVDNETISVNKPDAIEPEDPSDSQVAEETPVTNIILRTVSENENPGNSN